MILCTTLKFLVHRCKLGPPVSPFGTWAALMPHALMWSCSVPLVFLSQGELPVATSTQLSAFSHAHEWVEVGPISKFQVIQDKSKGAQKDSGKSLQPKANCRAQGPNQPGSTWCRQQSGKSTVTGTGTAMLQELEILKLLGNGKPLSCLESSSL